MKTKRKTKIIAFGLQKGGVGKTMSCLMISHIISQMGYKVLAIDYDPQGNLSEGFGFGYELTRGGTVFEIITGEEHVENCIIKTEYGVDLISANDDLCGLIEWMYDNKSKLGNQVIAILQNALYPVLSSGIYDYIFVDLPPSKDLITMTALTVVDKVVIPCQPESWAVNAIPRFLTTISDVKQVLNPKLDLAGILVTMADFRTGQHSDMVPSMRKVWGDLVFETVVRRRARLTDATLLGIKSLNKKDLEGDYYAAAKELVARG